MADLVRRPELGYRDVAGLKGEAVCDSATADHIETRVKCRLHCSAARRNQSIKAPENTVIPKGFDFTQVSGLSNEICQKPWIINLKTLHEQAEFRVLLRLPCRYFLST